MQQFNQNVIPHNLKDLWLSTESPFNLLSLDVLTTVDAVGLCCMSDVFCIEIRSSGNMNQ